MNNVKTLKVGDKATISKKILEAEVEMFANISGDFNPIHLNQDYALKTIFKKRIAHGFHVGSLISAVIGQKLPGNGTIYLSQKLQFVEPVYIDDVITAIIEVKDIPKPNRVVLNTLCINQKKQIVIIGEAYVIPPGNIKLIKD
jgi:3-hydroxybutyryl-CoA dehydratase